MAEPELHPRRHVFRGHSAGVAAHIRRPEKMRAACERMDRIREENRRLFGESNIAVQLIRETRDQA